MQVPLIVLSTLLVVTGPPPSAGTVLALRTEITVINDIDVPAQEAGLLTELSVLEGAQATAGQVLGKIDDKHALLQQEVANLKMKVAKAEAENDTNVEYAKAAYAVAESEYNRAIDANKLQKNVVPEAEVERFLLTWRRTWWEIKQAKMTQEIAMLQATVAAAEVRAADESLLRRTITAPFDATVEELYRRRGEWVKPGDSVLHLIQMDPLRVEGYLKASEVDPVEVVGQPVTVTVTLARGRKKTVHGNVVFVSDQVLGGSEFSVWAEVNNSQENDRWLLRPGLGAVMTITLKPIRSPRNPAGGR